MKEIEIVHLAEGVKFLGEAPSTPELQAWHARLEQEKAARKAAWESKSPDEKEQLEREEIKRGLKGAAMSPDQLEAYLQEAIAELRPEWESGWRKRRIGESPTGATGQVDREDEP